VKACRVDSIPSRMAKDVVSKPIKGPRSINEHLAEPAFHISRKLELLLIALPGWFVKSVTVNRQDITDVRRQFTQGIASRFS
jgi:hypothetical protein